MDKEQRKRRLTGLEIAEAHIGEEIASLKAQLAEPEKPALRHGVCAIGEDGAPFIVIEQSTLFGTPKAFYGDTGGTANADERIKEYKILIPNVFDDLAAMSEDVEEFETGNGMIVRFTEGRNLHFSTDCVLEKNIHAFILNLRRMEATDIRKK